MGIDPAESFELQKARDNGDDFRVRSSSRMTYALGALRAAKFLRDRQPGLYDMFDVLALK